MGYKEEDDEGPLVRRMATEAGSSCKSFATECCSVGYLKKRLPIVEWLPKYNFTKLVADAIAGLTVGLTVIPQGLAYAALAGLELQYGLYSAFMGSFIYCLLGTSRDITMGPTAIMSILVSEYAIDRWSEHDIGSEETTNPGIAVLLCFLCGIIQLLMAVFKLGFLVRYISHAVLIGFVSAASIIVSSTQIRKVFGLTTERGFFKTMYGIATQIQDTNLYDLAVGLTAMVLLFIMKWAKNKWSSPAEGDTTIKKVLKKTLWFIGTSRNAFIVLGASLIAWHVTDMDLPKEERPLTLTKKIDGGIPAFVTPSWTVDIMVPNPNYTEAHGNHSGIPHEIPETKSFMEIIYSISSGLIVVPIIGYLESIAIAKAFGNKHGYKVDSDQELFACGVSNTLSAFVSSYPITGSFGRSAVNAQSNVETPMGGLVTGAIVLLSLQYLSFAFQYIPAASLAAVIIMAVINLFDWEGIKHVWIINKIDFVPLSVTFLICFWDVALGIVAGIIISLILLLCNHARPKVRSQLTGSSLVVRLHRGLDFPGSEFVEEKLIDIAEQNDEIKSIVFDGDNVTNMDFSGAECFVNAAVALNKRNVQFKICGLRDHHVRMLLRAQGKNCEILFYDSVESALESSDDEVEMDMLENGQVMNL